MRTLTSPVKGGQWLTYTSAQAWVVGGAVPPGDVWERVGSRNDEILLQKLSQWTSCNGRSQNSSVGLWGYPSFPALRQDWRGAFMPFLCACPLCPKIGSQSPHHQIHVFSWVPWTAPRNCLTPAWRKGAPPVPPRVLVRPPPDPFRFSGFQFFGQ